MIENVFKRKLLARERQIGLWLAMADAYAASIAGQAGFDWLVIDAEHGPNDLRSILAQLQSIESTPSMPVVRPPQGEGWMIKQLLDIGAQTLLIPMVENAEQARQLVAACRYPPRGRRGMGAGIARASRFNTIPDYVDAADDQICLLVQIESRQGLDNLEAIAAIEGVDGLFIGPADLAADMGHTGNMHHSAVQAAVESAIGRIQACGKPAGILTFDVDLNRRYLELGATFVAVGADVPIFTAALGDLLAPYSASATRPPSRGY
ncbi:4-hydroxy-2-oxoheptanedioate aldolase [Novosphingobium sp. PS1R-30]|uniref:4-hydroxy-2-oxoheptanedioate aldolase n=1 Tax=Novosphingobium anseongense TaxID=3133436 RepID=A0ABU8S0G3_9SPHN